VDEPRPDVTITLIPYFGGPYDGERCALSDGVRAIAEGGYYEVEWMNGSRVAAWHHVEVTS
jgi:hypothetical protein